MNKLSYEQTIEHLKYGYSHTQSIARFIDQKAAAVIAAITTLSSLDFAVYKWALSFVKPDENQPYLFCYKVFWVLLILATAYLALSVFSAIQNAFAILNPKAPECAKPSAIFPYIPYKGEKVKLSTNEKKDAKNNKERVNLYLKGGRADHAVKDFTTQLKRMGEINYGKITHCQKAIRWVFHTIAASLLLAGIVTIFSFVLENG